jgi:hypothetical protein
MFIAADPRLSLILLELVLLAMAGGIGLIVLVPFFPGLAVILAAVLVYVAYASAVAGTLAGLGAVPLALIVAISVLGLTSGWWTERFGIHMHFVSPQVAYAGVIGSVIGTLLASMPGMLLGLMVGVVVLEIQRSPNARGLRNGFASLISLAGPRGFQLMLALLVSAIGLVCLPR